ncbi:hypothetical protein SCHPADRAFT_896324 [Schizopora paradoxa]|uniref:Uncharacterized protein n=1 Tax=Schizopora paradoxa TaxID=27342 RepID=A0A0H2RKM2_9AGAM|nr:hypothetical protein SCHPADRAFT_896324 [Schizopora paradoxa]
MAARRRCGKWTMTAAKGAGDDSRAAGRWTTRAGQRRGWEMDDGGEDNKCGAGKWTTKSEEMHDDGGDGSWRQEPETRDALQLARARPSAVPIGSDTVCPAKTVPQPGIAQLFSLCSVFHLPTSPSSSPSPIADVVVCHGRRRPPSISVTAAVVVTKFVGAVALSSRHTVPSPSSSCAVAKSVASRSRRVPWPSSSSISLPRCRRRQVPPPTSSCDMASSSTIYQSRRCRRRHQAALVAKSHSRRPRPSPYLAVVLVHLPTSPSSSLPSPIAVAVEHLHPTSSLTISQHRRCRCRPSPIPAVVVVYVLWPLLPINRLPYIQPYPSPVSVVANQL